MKERIIRFFKLWTLPLGMFAGVGIYLMFHYIPLLSPLKVLANGAEDYIMPFMIFVMLFTTFCKVNPREMRIRRWHVVMILFQLVCCLAVALPVHYFPDFGYSVVAQGALVCLIAPTGTAAAVIAGRLGGNETTLTTYTIVSNLVAAVMIPLVFPLVELHSAGSFAEQFALILRHVFPLLICPFLAAWALREFAPKAHALVVKFCGSLAFYLWGVSLVIAIGLTLRSVVNSHFNPHVLVLLALSGLIVCAWQFGTGKFVADTITTTSVADRATDRRIRCLPSGRHTLISRLSYLWRRAVTSCGRTSSTHGNYGLRGNGMRRLPNGSIQQESSTNKLSGYEIQKLRNPRTACVCRRLGMYGDEPCLRRTCRPT